MKQKKLFCKRLLTLVLSLAMIFTSVNISPITAQAMQLPADVELQAQADEGTVSDNQPSEGTVPADPTDLQVTYWETEDENKGKIKVTWSSEQGSAGVPENWIVYVDDEEVARVAVSESAEVFIENKYTAGEHTVKLTAANSAGESAGITQTFTLSEEQAGVKNDLATEEQRQALQSLYDTENAIVEAGNTKYTEESWKTYADAVAAAKAVLDNEKATAKEVEDATKAINDAKQALADKEEPSDPSEYIDLEAKSKIGVGELADTTKGIGVWTGVEANWSYKGTEATLTSSNWGQINEWSIQWAINGVELTPGEWTVEFDILSTIDKPAYFKVTRHQTGADNDTPLMESSGGVGGWTLKANQKEHFKATKTIDETGTVRLFFNLGGGTGAGTVTISNVKWVKTPGTEKAEAPALTTDKVSKQNGYKIGESPVLTFTDDEAWRNAVTAVKVNNKTVAEDKYTLAEGTLTLDSSLFAKQNVYKIEVEAEAYDKTAMTLPVYSADVANENWTKEWADEFDGTELDLTKWDYEIGLKSGDDETSSSPIYWGNNEKQYYTQEAVKLEDGKLVITGSALTDELKEKYNITDNTVKYSSARIRTVSEDGSDTMFATTYGRIEAAMELPNATGYWPAFWMLPTNETVDIYGTWASSGEIDIMEAGQSVDTVDGTIHYGSTWPNNVYSGGHYTFPEPGAAANSHVYAVEWEPGEIRWYVDDILYHVENNWYAKGEGASSNYAYPAPFDEDFYILFNLALGGNYIGNVEPSAEDLGKSMKVDYVRVYKDTNADYDKDPDAPDVDRDSEFFEANKKHADENGNYIKDPEFETLKDHQMGDGATVEPGLGYWSSATNTGLGAATDISVADKDGAKFAKIDVTKTGANNYDVQLIQHVPLAKGYAYKLTFDAYTDAAGGRNFSVAPKGDGDNGWKGYDSGITPNLTSEVQSFEYIFTMTSDSDPTARIEMNLGNTTGSVYVGNVKLVALSDKELEDIENEKLNGKKKPLDNGEHIYNGGFDQGAGRFVYWNKVGEYDVDTSNRTMKATITNSAAIDDVALKQPGIQLLKGDDYKLTLKARADSPKNIKVGLYSKDGRAYAEMTKEITAEMAELALEFTMDKEVTDEEAVLIIAFGGDTVSVEIDDVSMKRTSDRNVEWNTSILYPLGGETWSNYTYLADPDNGGAVEDKEVPADGVVTEKGKPATNAWTYMIMTNAALQVGYSYELSFDIKSSVDAQIVTAKIEDGTYTATLEQNVETTTEWQTVNTTFKSIIGSGSALKFLFSNSKNKECDFSIRNVTLKVVDGPYLVMDSVPSELTVGETVQLNVRHAVEVNPAYETYQYASSDDKVVTVSESGLLTAVAEGSAKITVTSGAGAIKTFTVKVTATQQTPDKEELNEAVVKYEGYKEEDYTPESWKEFAKALKTAKEVAAKEGATQQEIADALAALEAAAAGLVKADQPGPGPVKEGLWIEEIPDQTYTGAAIKPVVRVYDGETPLKEKTDYTVSFKKNTNKGTADVIVKGKGNYAKTYTAHFEIVAKDIGDADITAPDVYTILTAQGTIKKNPKVTVKFGKKALKAATATKENDYSLTWDEIPKDAEGKLIPGSYTIIVTGHGNYTGTRNIAYDVCANDTILMSKVKISLSKSKVDYKDGGETERPEVVSATYGSGAKKVTLDPETDYRVDYVNADQVGKATVIVTAIPGTKYYGSKSQTYTVTGTALKAKDFDVQGISSEGYTYTGSEVTVDGLKVYDKNRKAAEGSQDLYEMQEGKDYTVGYNKNVNAGTAVITLTGKGGYTGSFTKTFKINKMDLGKKNQEGSGLEWSCAESAVHTKNKAVPGYTLVYNGVPLTEKKDYKVTCKKNAAVTDGKTATITIKGAGNFSGTIEETYAVTTPDVSTIYAVSADVAVPRTLNKLKASLKVYEASTGKALKAGSDYDKTFRYYILEEDGTERDVTAEDLKEDQIIHAVITLKGNYAGSGEAASAIRTQFRLYKVKAFTFTVEKIEQQAYTGKAIEPEVVVYKDRNKTEKLTEGVDYRVNYSNNIKKGTAKVTITGIGNGYGGVKTVTFKIGTRNMDIEGNWAQKAAKGIADFFRNLF